MTEASSILDTNIIIKKMRTLVDLPNELIFDIIAFTLSTSRISILTNTKRRRLGDDFKGDRVCFIDSDAAYKPNALALLLTSKALNAQTALYISKSSRACEFDIAIVNAVYFFPTWRSIPTRNGSVSAILDTVKVNLIPCCTQEVISMATDWPTRYPPSAANFNTPVGDTSIFPQFWEVQLFNVIARYFAVGATRRYSDATEYREWSDYTTTDEDSTHPICTQRLVINVDTSKYNTICCALEDDFVPAREIVDRKYSQHDFLYPVEAVQTVKMMKWLAFLMQKKLRSAQNGNNVRTVYFAIERIGRIEFMVDGKTIETVNVSDYAPGEEETLGENLSEASQRRMRLWKTRKELGL